MAKKRRRLKKPIRRALMGIGAAAEVATAITLTNGSLFMKQSVVEAQANPKDVINAISKLKNNDLSNMKSLKSYVLETYSSVNVIDDIDTEESKVLLVTPTVVTKPSVQNSSIVIVPVAKTTATQDNASEEETGAPEATLSQSLSDSTERSSSDAKATAESSSKTSDSSSEPVTTAKTDEQSSDSSVTSAKEETKTTEATEESKKVDSEASQNASQKEGESNDKGDDEGTTADIAQGFALETPKDSASVVELEDSQGVAEEVLTGLTLKLNEDEVVINDGSEFVAEDHIKEIDGDNGILPTLKIAGKVDSLTDGEYKVTYTVVGTNGQSVSKDLKVIVKGNEEAKKAREEASTKAINEFVEKYTGKHVDVDGYYGDQCWDLWGRFICDLGLYKKYDCGTGSYGYAYGVFLRYDKTNAKKYFEKIENADELQAGDWVFWDKGSSCADSHVALMLKNNGDGTGEFLTQSYGNGTRVMTLKLDVMGGFRPIGNASWYNLAS